MQLLKKLKNHWGIESNWQILMILIVFSITGFTSLFARRLIFPLIGVEAGDPFWFKTIIWLLTIFPVYNILLLVYAALFGQFDFFWRFFKKMMSRFTPGKSSL
ncbi:MAG TPA: DUF6787 family protein [Gracilimonas sp.]|uniref:DUF6787 family protein n=1 Tax=Gracilimonas sp. TaxID=1974203 RepID=UPI002D9408B5|nr:DUF6787 family protein [Gracilimonas sp.]